VSFSVDQLLGVLAAAQDRLAAAVQPLSLDLLTGPAYPSEWSIAQVMSNLGSGTEIFGLYARAGLAREPLPGQERFQEIWDRWNAKAPDQQVADSINAGVTFRQRIGALTPEERSAFRLGLFGMDLDLAGLVMLRVSEQVVHGWDVHVALDPKATLFSDGVALMLDGLGQVARLGKPTDEVQLIAVTTEAPDRRLLLAIGPDGPSVTEAGEGDIKATLRLPAEALVRLVFGRLDPIHTPPVQTEGVDLDLLRKAFPGL
jgi:uncharacterized protein (TIGR03083 family)